MKTFRHDFRAYIAIPIVIGVVAYCGVQMWIFDGDLRGGEPTRFLFVAFAALFSITCAYLYARFVLVKYHLSDDGLLVRRPWATSVRAWRELQPPIVNRHLKYLSVRDSDGRQIIFTSLDFFSDIQEFYDELARKIDEHKKG